MISAAVGFTDAWGIAIFDRGSACVGVSRGRRGCGGVRPRSAAWWQMRMRTGMRVRTHLHEAVGDDARQQPKGEGGQPRHLRIHRKEKKTGRAMRAKCRTARECVRRSILQTRDGMAHTHTRARAIGETPAGLAGRNRAATYAGEGARSAVRHAPLRSGSVRFPPMRAASDERINKAPTRFPPKLRATTAGPFLLLFPFALSQENRKGE